MTQTDEKSNTRCQYRRYVDFFSRIWGEQKPLAKLFRTTSCGYLYDTGSNKIIGCNEIVFNLLENLFSKKIEQAISEFVSEKGMEHFLYAADTIKNAVETENLLLTRKAEQFDLSDHFQNYEELIDSSLEILFLEVTENCNLRCDYCVYNDFIPYRRNHGKSNMELSLAKRAIDYLNEHSYKRKNVAINFYGGEPLLQFNLIKSCIDFAEANIKNREIDFSITTNATLISPEIAEFFFRKNLNVFVSIDGPEDIHDDYRKDANGVGSYKRSIRGFKYLIDAYGEQADNKISLSMVYTPPFSGKRIDRISELWEEIPWLPKNTSLNITYPSRGSIPVTRASKTVISEDIDLKQWAFKKFLDKYLEKGDSHPIADSIMEKKLAQLIQRPIFHEPFDHYYLNGCCLPGVKRIYVATDGKFHLCEKIPSNSPTIGDIDSGVDIDIIKRVYIDGYLKISIPLCSRCWAVRLCTSCYTDVFKNGTLDSETKKKNCISEKYSQEQLMEQYCTLMELKSGGLNYLYNFELI